MSTYLRRAFGNSVAARVTTQSVVLAPQMRLVTMTLIVQ